MSMDLVIALRGVVRNRRRSLATLLTLLVGTAAILLFGAFVVYLVRSFETGTVQRTGHLALYKKGFTLHGAADPLGYGIADYQAIIRLLQTDPQLGPMVAVVTPTQVAFGIAGNERAGKSKNFVGLGIVREDQYRMERWNAYGIVLKHLDPPIRDTDIDKGDIGVGLARLLEICSGLKVKDCGPKPAQAAAPPAAPASNPFAALLAQDQQDREAAAAAAGGPRRDRIELLAPTAKGAPNIVGMVVVSASGMGSKDLDDSLVKMSLPLAQRLVYGRHPPAASSVVLQLKETSQVGDALRRVRSLIAERQLDLEVRTFRDLVPLYGQVINFLGMIFGFISTIIGIVVLFSVVNTMSMSVMERTTEIGTMRALGASRGEIGAQFVLEGTLIGAFGTVLGAALALLSAAIVNASNLKWSPPTSVEDLPLRILLSDQPAFVVLTCAALTVLCALAALSPARKAARMEIGDALRHV